MLTTSKPLVLNALMTPTRRTDTKMAIAALLGAVPDFDLACMGTSIGGLGAFTFEAFAYMATADLVYCYPVTVKHLTLMGLIAKKVINLHDSHYQRGSEFDVAYDLIIEDVMKSVRQGNRVAYATQGSPVFHCGTAVSLHRRAKDEGFASILVPGVSSFELLSAVLSEDYNLRSLQALSVPDLMGGQTRIDPTLAGLFFDLGRFVLSGVRNGPATLKRDALSTFCNHLKGIYPDSQKVVLLYILGNGTCSKMTTAIHKLETDIREFVEVPTLFIPGLSAEPH